MISRNLYFNILIRIILTIAFSLLFAYFVLMGDSMRLYLITGIVLIFIVINLITYLNSINRKIRYFFDAVKNDDSGLHFPEDVKNPVVREIYNGMNRINRQLQQLKMEITKQEQFFKTLIEHLATGILTYNEKGFILHVNSATKRLLSMDILTHLKQIERVDHKLYDAISGIKPSERRLVAFNPGEGEIQLSLKATDFSTEGMDMTILSIQDIKNELDEKELESWMKLIRVLMHEIMNSITPITSLSESLSRIYRKDGNPVLPDEVTTDTIERTLQGLEVIKEQGKGLMAFVDSYRRLTRVPEPDKKPFKVMDLINRVKVIYNSFDNSDMVNLSFTLEDPALKITADQNLISQVLINLVKNALEANESNREGEIKIVVGTGNDFRPEICVIDNGPGIAAENIDEIFVPFFTTRHNGSGIGLSLSKQIMKDHGGNLKVKSDPGSETAFCLSF
jgi:two-component system, NtrC family, nitrogen regulation sensor histidine kinase NtrY